MIFAALHELDIPEIVAVLWRCASFILAACLLGGFIAFIQAPDQPKSRRIFMSVLIIVTIRYVVVNIQRFDDVVYWEGLPVDTVWMLLASWGLWKWIKEREEM